METRLPMAARRIPTNKAKKMIGSISPEDREVKIFFGIIFNNVSAKSTWVVATLVASSGNAIFKPTPGLIRLAIPSATQIAKAVVHR